MSSVTHSNAFKEEFQNEINKAHAALAEAVKKMELFLTAKDQEDAEESTEEPQDKKEK